MNWLSYVRDNWLKAGMLLRSPGATRFSLNRALWDIGYPWTHLTPTPLDRLFPGIVAHPATLELVRPFDRQRGTSVELEELIVILAIQRFTNATRVAEVGTFDGNTTIHLALNAGPDGRVVTIDLPPEGADTTDYARTGRPAPFARRQYDRHPAASRIRQVLGDSAVLDWSTLGGPFDLVFIDGDHRAEYVRADTKNALGSLRPGGLILWHDYEYRSVSGVLDPAARAGERIHWIRGTRIALGIFDSPDRSIRHFESATAPEDAARQPIRP